MKKLSLLLVIVFLPAISLAQWIVSLTVSPAIPQSTDTIYVYAGCSFQSGNCDDKTQYMVTNGNTVSAYAIHCLGIAAFICSDIDTFKINPLPAGNYNFIFQLDAGMGPSPCTPGIAAGPVDSVAIHVVASTGITQQQDHSNTLQMLQGTKAGSFICRMPSMKHWPVTLHVYNNLGQRILSPVITGNNQEIDLSALGAGIYVISSDDIQTTGVRIRIE